ncbi:MAG: hypothetical protein PUC33_01620 [Oscillospiraceae bacterium]|nr:hypothetical protein [Oscillospiraceae bacterium]MDD6147245.1 hypothetical protein [Oscillospiraceae bacterium]
MSESVIVAIISLAGTLLGTFAGIITSGKLTNYRIAELEKRVEKHNTIIERTYTLEKRESLSEEKLRLMDQRITNLERNSSQHSIN